MAEAHVSCSAESDDRSIFPRRCYGCHLGNLVSPCARKIFTVIHTTKLSPTIAHTEQRKHRPTQGMRRRYLVAYPSV